MSAGAEKNTTTVTSHESCHLFRAVQSHPMTRMQRWRGQANVLLKAPEGAPLAVYFCDGATLSRRVCEEAHLRSSKEHYWILDGVKIVFGPPCVFP